jgi:hypothetical protein
VKEEYNTERGRAMELILLSGIGTAALLAAELCELCGRIFRATHHEPNAIARRPRDGPRWTHCNKSVTIVVNEVNAEGTGRDGPLPLRPEPECHDCW